MGCYILQYTLYNIRMMKCKKFYVCGGKLLINDVYYFARHSLPQKIAQVEEFVAHVYTVWLDRYIRVIK